MNPMETNVYTSIVARVLRIQDITVGDAKQKFLYRYRGELYGDSMDAYDRLADSLRPLDVTPLFRNEGGLHVIYLEAGTFAARPSNPWINLLLFGLTLLSVLFAGAFFSGETPDIKGPADVIPVLLKSVPFAVSLLAILSAHEFGHYLVGRYHNTQVSLPYFLPFPLSPFGTLGAFINMKEIPKNRRVLMDIGIAGPFAGMAVAVPVLLYGLSLSKLDVINLSSGTGFSLEGNSILYLLAKYVVFGQLLPAPSDFGGLSPVMYWIRYFFTGSPLPLGGLDVMIHPIAWAGWAGLLVTSMNLIPAGQLDGGHLIYVLLGERARKLLPFVLGALLLLGIVWEGWWLWALLIYLLGRFHAEPLDQITPLDARRKIVAVLGLLLFILVFTPVPLVNVMSGG